ncbi:MAG: PadR family transcriptional regulator [Conexivisphaerales archaeon]
MIEGIDKYHKTGMRRIKAPQGVLRTLIIALASKSPVTGKDIIEKIKKESDGKWTPSPGSVYYIIEKLVTEQMIMQMPHAEEKSYIATSKGLEVLKEEGKSLKDSVAWSLMVLSMLVDTVEPEERQRMQLIHRIMNLSKEKISELASIIG